MSTRTYTLNFTAAGMLPLPQGRFFMVKTAAAALSINARRRDGQPIEFANVGAGLQFNGLESERWYSLEVTSAVAQVVEIVISDEGSVTFSNTVSVAGTVPVVELPCSAIANTPSVLVGTVQGALFPANLARRRITVQSNPLNTDNISLRTIGGANTIYVLVPGMAYTWANTAGLDAISGTAAQQVLIAEEA